MGSRLEKNSSQVRKRIEGHSFEDEEGEEYEPSKFGGFGDYFRRKKIKLQNLDANLRAASSDKPQLFKGIVAHVSGYTQPSLSVLHRELVQHGAGFLQYLDGKTMATHIVASTLPPKKAVEFSRYRIVKPAWVMDSIKAGKLLPWTDYRVLDDGPKQKIMNFSGGSFLSQATPGNQTGYKEQSRDSFYANEFANSASKSQTPMKTQHAGVHQETPSRAPLQRPQSSAAPSHPSSSGQYSDGFDDSIFDQMEIEMPGSLANTQKTTPTAKPLATQSPAPLAVIREEVARPMSRELELDPPEKKEPSNDPDSRADELVVPQVSGGKMPENMTSEEHNAWLLSDPRMRKSSTANPNFLQQYYSESRLHHLSTWKAELKSKMQRLAKEAESGVKVAKRKPGSRRYILHVDFDSFFCAVSLKKHPELVDKPVVIAHSPGHGSEIASCNYPSRKFGVKNGMWMKKAVELCPELRVLPYDFPAYEEASALFYEAILTVGGIVQSVSVDEALLDVSAAVYDGVGSDGGAVDEGSIWREQEFADALALDLRKKIKAKTDCDVSVGIGGNILQAKVALRRAKPAGQYQLKPDDVLDMIGELEVRGLPGVAHSMSGKLEEVGIKFVKDIRSFSKEKLSGTLGPKTGEKLWEYARGIDRTEVGEQAARKSVSAEVNWGIRFINQAEAEEFIMNLCKELERRLLNEQVKGKQLTLKVMRRSLDAPLDPVKHLGHGKCDTFNKSIVFGVATHNGETIGKEAVSILRSLKLRPGDLRGLGAQMTKLEPIKTGPTAVDGSQKRLAFPTFSAPTSAKKSKTDPIEEMESPQKKKLPIKGFVEDPIADDPLTPKKPKPVHPALAIARAGAVDAKATTPLNIAGTQFIMPTQVDPSVLAELPQDIRSKLQSRQQPLSFARAASPATRPRSDSPAVFDAPPPSQVDPEVFNALPDDMKAEVLASYGRRPTPVPMPQSPRRDRIIQAKKATTPTRRGRGGARKTRERLHDAANRMQTNFMPRQADAAAAQEDLQELDPDFLAELPEELRREVVEDHRRKRLARRGGLNLAAPARRPQQAEASGAQSSNGKLRFPAAPPKVDFTGTGVTAVADVKDMLEAWHGQSKEEGPHKADVQMFETYLGKVVLEERNMNKAVQLVKWVDFLTSTDPGTGPGKRGWQKALAGVKHEVQEAVKQRGLGPVSF
ncbi:hypothetical protein BN1708_009154 [Verticillium longisporum]|uniref:DNA repair protein REV1 n=1 Tax=Verticillium longisporum TaxID=100787 RepID=A0A0G4KE40_VERLO|nr:hypothetical protein BN1708_009154 [Verticillium longisporum]